MLGAALAVSCAWAWLAFEVRAAPNQPSMAELSRAKERYLCHREMPAMRHDPALAKDTDWTWTALQFRGARGVSEDRALPSEGKYYVRWTEAAATLIVTVQNAHYHNPHAGAGLVEGDSLLVMARRGEHLSMTAFAGDGRGNTREHAIRSTREASMTARVSGAHRRLRYEIEIDPGALGLESFSPGDRFELAFRSYDADADGLMGWFSMPDSESSHLGDADEARAVCLVDDHAQ